MSLPKRSNWKSTPSPMSLIRGVYLYTGMLIRETGAGSRKWENTRFDPSVYPRAGEDRLMEQFGERRSL